MYSTWCCRKLEILKKVGSSAWNILFRVHAVPKCWRSCRRSLATFVVSSAVNLSTVLDTVLSQFYPPRIMTTYFPKIHFTNYRNCRPQWPRGLRRGSAMARLLRLWVRIPPGSWTYVYCRLSCVVRERSLRRADHSSRGVLPNVLRRVWSRNLVIEDALSHWELLH